MATFSPLPSGRHGLTREQVRASQRARLMHGMAETVAEAGYHDTSVAAVIRRVHVSRQTFYEHFADKQDCFLATLGAAGGVLADALMESLAEEGRPRRRLERMLATYFTRLREQQALSRVFFVESAAAGTAAARARVDVQQRFVDLIADAFRDTAYWKSEDPEFACRMLVGGMSSLVTASLVTEGTCPPPETADRLVALADRLFTTGSRLDAT